MTELLLFGASELDPFLEFDVSDDHLLQLSLVPRHRATLDAAWQKRGDGGDPWYLHIGDTRRQRPHERMKKERDKNAASTH